jgi:hypothetical protein
LGEGAWTSDLSIPWRWRPLGSEPLVLLFPASSRENHGGAAPASNRENRGWLVVGIGLGVGTLGFSD